MSLESKNDKIETISMTISKFNKTQSQSPLKRWRDRSCEHGNANFIILDSF